MTRVAIDYKADLFVTPREPYRWVLSKVKQWQRGGAKGFLWAIKWSAREHGSSVAPGDRVLSLVGERGVGKTWLLRHLAEQERQVSPMAVYLDLERRTEFPEPREYVEVVEDQVQSRRDREEVILLLDTVPPHLDEHLRALEDTILRPYLARCPSLVIMALVYPSQVCWRSPALRGGATVSLPPFEESQTREQLQRLTRTGAVRGQLEALDIQQCSGGLPLLNCLLATHGKAEAFALLLEYWFSRIPVEECERVQGYLEAVCMLDVLEHVSIERALEVYERYWSGVREYPVHPGGIRNVLRKYWLARPSPGSPGRIVLIESVRRAAIEVLKARDAELYTLLSEVAHVAGGRQG